MRIYSSSQQLPQVSSAKLSTRMTGMLIELLALFHFSSPPIMDTWSFLTTTKYLNSPGQQGGQLTNYVIKSTQNPSGLRCRYAPCTTNNNKTLRVFLNFRLPFPVKFSWEFTRWACNSQNTRSCFWKLTDSVLLFFSRNPTGHVGGGCEVVWINK